MDKFFKISTVLSELFLLSLIFSCDIIGENNERVIGGPCTYHEIPGTATIISINDASSSDNNCSNDPVEVIFNFTPDDPAEADINIDNNQYLTVGDGKNPPRTYIINKGISAGSTHESNRRDITSGACTPHLFEFINIDLSDYGQSCF